MKGSGEQLSPYDLKRLQAYSNSLVDHHMIMDLVPPLAHAYFSQGIAANLSYIQAAILLTMGLQAMDITGVQDVLQLPSNQVCCCISRLLFVAFSVSCA